MELLPRRIHTTFGGCPSTKLAAGRCLQMQWEASRALDRLAILSQTHYTDAVQECAHILRDTGLSICGTRSAQYREAHDMRSAEAPEQGKTRMRHAFLAGSRFRRARASGTPDKSTHCDESPGPLWRDQNALPSPRSGSGTRRDLAPRLVGRTIRNRGYQHLMEPNRR